MTPWSGVQGLLNRVIDPTSKMTGLAVAELQADEIRTIVGGKRHPLWILTAIDVFQAIFLTRAMAELSRPWSLGAATSSNSCDDAGCDGNASGYSYRRSCYKLGSDTDDAPQFVR